MSSRLDTPFEWGSNDCCLFAADIVQAITGHDFAASFRGTYSDAFGASSLLGSLGGIVKIASDRFDEIEIAFAQIGDIGRCESEGRDTFCVWGGEHWHAPGAAGIVVIDPATVEKAWRISLKQAGHSPATDAPGEPWPIEE